MPAPPEHVSVSEAQKMLGLSRQRAYQLVELGRLDSIKTGDGRLWVSLASIARRQEQNARQNSANCIAAHEVASFFGVEVKTVHLWFTGGLLKGTKIHNRLCFAPGDVIKFVPPSQVTGRNPSRRPSRILRGRHYPEPTGKGSKKKPPRGKESSGQDRNQG